MSSGRQYAIQSNYISSSCCGTAQLQIELMELSFVDLLFMRNGVEVTGWGVYDTSTRCFYSPPDFIHCLFPLLQAYWHKVKLGTNILSHAVAPPCRPNHGALARTSFELKMGLKLHLMCHRASAKKTVCHDQCRTHQVQS